jgi:hypothetical protein
LFPAFEFTGRRQFQTVERRSHPVKTCRRNKMQSFPVLTIDTAPEKSTLALLSLQGAFGMIPNVAGTMATSPVLIDSLVALFGKVHGGSFTEAQIQTLLLTNAVHRLLHRLHCRSIRQRQEFPSRQVQSPCHPSLLHPQHECSLQPARPAAS